MNEKAIAEGLRAMEDTLADGGSNDTAFRMGLGVALALQSESPEHLALRNVLGLTLKIKRYGFLPEYVDHLLRFCKEGGVEPTILRNAEFPV